jgi:hypothetical protein
MINISKGVQTHPVKAVIYGVEGIGKTTFAARFPKPLFIDLDRGSQRMDVARIGDVTQWGQLSNVMKAISEGEAEDFSTIVIDTADMAAEMCKKYICAKNQKNNIEDFGYGKGYAILAQEFALLINWATVLIDKGFNVVFLAHSMQRVVTRPDDTGSYDHWEMKLPGKGNNSIGALLKEWADLLLFADYHIAIRQGADGKGKATKTSGERVMRANHSPFADAKNRFGLPDEMPFEYGEIAKCIPERKPQTMRAQTVMGEAYQRRKDFENGKEPAPPEKPKALKGTPLEQLKALMEKGCSDADPVPITEEELFKAIQTVEDDPAIKSITKMEDLPEEYIRNTFLTESNWRGFTCWILNNLRIPF